MNNVTRESSTWTISKKKWELYEIRATTVLDLIYQDDPTCGFQEIKACLAILRNSWLFNTHTRSSFVKTDCKRFRLLHNIRTMQFLTIRVLIDFLNKPSHVVLCNKVEGIKQLRVIAMLIENHFP